MYYGSAIAANSINNSCSKGRSDYEIRKSNVRNLCLLLHRHHLRLQRIRIEEQEIKR